MFISNIRNLRRGKHRLVLWPGVEADGSLETSTPSKLATQDEMGRLEKVVYPPFLFRPDHIDDPSKLVKKYERGDLPKNDWLDKMSFRKMEEIHAVCLLLYSMRLSIHIHL